MSTNEVTNRSWVGALATAAQEYGIALPPFTTQGMGGARCSGSSGRFATLKRRLVRDAAADLDGIEWTLWQTAGGQPEAVAAFRESRRPRTETVAVVLSLLKGWLIDGWSEQTTRDAVGKHPMAQPVEPPHQPAAQ